MYRSILLFLMLLGFHGPGRSTSHTSHIALHLMLQEEQTPFSTIYRFGTAFFRDKVMDMGRR